MFERFTEKAIKVIMLAQEEARRLGHNFVGTEQILLGLIGGPLSGVVYFKKSAREEKFELRLINENENDSTFMRLRAHRDELISLENELGEKLQLKSDGSLFKTPI